MCLSVLHSLLMPIMFGQMDRTGTLWTAELREDDPSTKLKRVDITDVPVGSELIKIDGAREPEYFLDDAGQRRRCDYLLITKANNGQRILLFIEMKSNTVNSTEVTQKFRASECLLDYIESMLERFHDCPANIFELYEKRFVRFQTKNSNIRGTRRNRRKGDGSKPDTMKIVVQPKGRAFDVALEPLIR